MVKEGCVLFFSFKAGIISRTTYYTPFLNRLKFDIDFKQLTVLVTWSERAVLPLRPELVGPYCREYKGETKEKLKKEAEETLHETEEGNLKKCAREGCGRYFRPKNNRALYWEDYRKLLEKERKRKWWSESRNEKKQEGYTLDVYHFLPASQPLIF